MLNVIFHVASVHLHCGLIEYIEVTNEKVAVRQQPNTMNNSHVVRIFFFFFTTFQKFYSLGFGFYSNFDCSPLPTDVGKHVVRVPYKYYSLGCS